MFELMVEKTFSAAHQLVDYKGPCENLHGHNWKVQVIVQGTQLDHVGMLVDFKILKGHIHDLLKKLDHTFLNDKLEFSPTSEMLSKYLYGEMENRIPKNVTLKRVIIWESDNTCAAYEP